MRDLFVPAQMDPRAAGSATGRMLLYVPLVVATVYVVRRMRARRPQGRFVSAVCRGAVTAR